MAGYSSHIAVQTNAITAEPSPTSGRGKIAALIAAHAVLSAAPVLSDLGPRGRFFLPYIWLTSVGAVGALLTLSFWLGMGRQRFVVRLVLTVAGCAYIAVWPLMARPVEWSAALANQYLETAAYYGVVVIAFGAGFLVMRRWVSLRRVSSDERTLSKERFQFSVRNMLVLMLLTAAVMTFVQLERDGNPDVSFWKMAAAAILGFGIFFMNTILASHAALGAARPAPRIAAAAFIAWLLGVAMSMAARQDEVAWWLVPVGGLIITVIPTMIVAASLLLVRSCGYRLVPTERNANPH